MSVRERSWSEDRFQAVLGLRVSGLGERLQPTPPSHRPSSSNPTPDLPEHAEARTKRYNSLFPSVRDRYTCSSVNFKIQDEAIPP